MDKSQIVYGQKSNSLWTSQIVYGQNSLLFLLFRGKIKILMN